MSQMNAESNAVLYKQLNDLDDQRERLIKASSTGRHEPSAMFDGLYDIEEIDDGGRLIERRERSADPAFVPVSELPASAKHRPFAPTGKKPGAPMAAAAHVRDDRPAVLRRRGTTLRAL